MATLSWAGWTVAILGIYLAVGALFALPFISKGAARIDPGAHGAPIGFRLLILPGVVALWPFLAVKWVRAKGGPS